MNNRDWSAAHAKIDAQPHCRVCGCSPVDPAHIVPRSRVSAGLCGEYSRNIVGLCRAHHRAYDTGDLDLLPHLYLSEQAYAVVLVGIVEAYLRTTYSKLVS